MKEIKISVEGGAKEIGAFNAIFLEYGHTKILIDYGGGYKYREIKEVPKDIDAFLLTHAHFDHCGYAPLLYSESGENPPAYMTVETKELSILSWQSYLAICENSGLSPRYSEWQFAKIWENTRLITPGKSFEVGEFKITPIPVGHILGAVGYYIEAGSRRVFVTGDFSIEDTHYPYIDKFDYRQLSNKVDLLVMNATYAGRDLPTFKDEGERFNEAGERIIRAKKIALIPSFTIDRPQKLLYLIRQYGFEKYTYIDGGARSAFSIYEQYTKIPMKGAEYLFVNRHDSHERSESSVLEKRPLFLIASSGMMIPGTASHSWFTRFCRERELEIFFPGFIQSDSFAGQLWGEKSKNSKELKWQGETYPLDCQISQYEFSAHARQEELAKLNWTIRPIKTLYLHCLENETRKFIQDNGFVGDHSIPENGETIFF